MELRGLIVKFGQQMSTRPELMPPAYIQSLRVLQSHMPAEDSSVIAAVIEAELQAPLDELFAQFDARALGAASVAQAHRATTHDGQDVVVKVQLPGVPAMFAADLRSLRTLVRLTRPEAQPVFDEFSRQYESELDFARERRNLAELHDALLPRYARSIDVPRVLPALCSARVLTMSYLPGEPLERAVHAGLRAAGVEPPTGGVRQWIVAQEDAARAQGRARRAALGLAARVVGVSGLLWAFAALERACALAALALAALARAASSVPIPGARALHAAAAERDRAARARLLLSSAAARVHALLDVYGHQVFGLGLFNADPHPGNVLVMPDGRLGLIDYGQCKRLDASSRARIARLVVAVADRAPDAHVADTFRDLGIRTERDDDAFIASLARMLLSRVDGAMLRSRERRALMRSDRILSFPPELVALARATALLRGSALALRCNISPAEQWRGHAEAALALGPSAEAEAAGTTAKDSKLMLPAHGSTVAAAL